MATLGLPREKCLVRYLQREVDLFGRKVVCFLDCADFSG